ncbi:hypothetical protein PIB30_050582 [Stylosanthes scabra]|uniref:Uncharacterized protein n=1 Tax=Stylosanthes scabra TaxID=79078 RepID=A0ABU6TI30_9FABA|nr:hypothetical protein [Stylosanthes scabra]
MGTQSVFLVALEYFNNHQNTSYGINISFPQSGYLKSGIREGNNISRAIPGWARGIPIVQKECSFFQWADPDSDSFLVEFGKMKKRVDSLKLRGDVAHRHCKAAIVFGLLG